MFRRICCSQATCLGLLLGLLFVVPVFASSDYTDDDRRRGSQYDRDAMRAGWVVVKFKENVPVTTGASKTGRFAFDKVGERFQVQAIQKMFPFLDGMSASKKSSLKGVENLSRVYSLKISEEMDPRRAAAAFSGLADVEYAEPWYVERITRTSSRPAWFEPYTQVMATPNDPTFAQMSHLDHVSLPAAWDVVKGEDGNVVIAVIDGGTDWNHPDLAGNVWTNPGEIAGNGVDDDGNDFTDDINGWNFPQDAPDPTGLTATPINASHGTETVGVAAAVTDNGTGVAGASWNATYMPVNISCPETDLAICFSFAGMVYGASNGADIVNASLGGPFRSFLGQEVVNFAVENGTLIVAAAGNDGQNTDIFPHYPANYEGALSVGATNKNFDAIASFSNFGISVDVFAPGVGINTTNPNSAYGTSQGTSFSSPLVAAVVALVKTQHPDWTPIQIGEQVRATSDDISSTNNTFRYRGKLGKGRLNALRAVTEATPSVRVAAADIRDGTGSSRIDPNEFATVTVDVVNFLEPVSDLTVTLESTSTELIVVQPTATIASLGTGDTTQVQFDVVTPADIPFNVQASLNTRFASGDYTDIDGLAVVVNSSIHNTGNIEVQLTQEGNLGWTEFQGESEGIGFRYEGGDYLFEGGLIFGNSATTISDNVRTDDNSPDIQEMDLTFDEGSEFGIIDGRETTEEGALQLVDTAADTPLNIRVRQDSYADTAAVNRDFIILKYTIENTGDSEIANFYAGLFFDWDSFTDAQNDYARYEAGRNMGYFLNGAPESADVFLATKLLSDGASPSWRSIDNTTEIYGGANAADPNDGFTETEKWNFISGGIQTQSVDATDISTLMAGGPFTIAAGESAEVAFAIVAGTSLTDLQTHADAAQLLWDEKISTLGPNPVSNEEPGVQPVFSFALDSPYPNPIHDQATINFELPQTGAIELGIYDMLGRQIRTLASGTKSAGRHSINWDGRDNAGVRLASGVYMLTLTSPTNEGLKTATRKVVVVR